MPLERLGPYRISRLLGRGGMGAVYEATHTETGQRAAVKILSFALSDDEAFRQRFESEIETLKRLRHPNIVQLIGYGQQDGVLFYSMELVEGENLHHMLARGQRMKWREATEVAIQVCAALKHAHDHGVIHRDLKPANLLLSRDGVIKLTDFGIAKFFGGTQLTSVGGVIGTADYMSPEQAEGRGVTARSDLYGLGAVLYALIAGRPPYPGSNVTEIMQRMLSGPPPTLHNYDVSIPLEFEEIVMQLLEHDPAARIATPLAVSKRLRAMLYGLAAQTKLERDPNSDDVSPHSTTQVVPPDPGGDSDDVTLAATNTPPTPADHWDRYTVVTSVSAAPQHDGGNDAPESQVRYTEVEADRARPRAVDPAAEQRRPNWQQALSTLALLLLIAALIAAGYYLSRPPSADVLFQRIRDVALAEDARQWAEVRKEIDEYLRLYPTDHRAATVRQWRSAHDAHRLWRRLEREARRRGGVEFLPPIERAYVEASRQRQLEPKLALQQFQQLLDQYGHVEPETEDARDCLTAARFLAQQLHDEHPGG